VPGLPLRLERQRCSSFYNLYRLAATLRGSRPGCNPRAPNSNSKFETDKRAANHVDGLADTEIIAHHFVTQPFVEHYLSERIVTNMKRGKAAHLDSQKTKILFK